MESASCGLRRATAALIAACLAAGCGGSTPSASRAGRNDARGGDLVARIDVSLASAARFLVRAQSPDGAWRSNVYGFFRDGPPLTPHVLSTLYFLEQGGREARRSFEKGAGYLSAMVASDGRIEGEGLSFPVYTSAEASWVLGMARNRSAQNAWLAYLRAHQLDEALGWFSGDAEFGGWGYSVERPRKPEAGKPRPPLVESNLSATLFALGALRSASIPRTDPAYEHALVFVERCQNFCESPGRCDPRYDDGGFFFIPGDAAKNKAGPSGQDRLGRERYHSYGSMTADGLRALVQCGLRHAHPRVVAARAWLERHFAAGANPGAFNPDREALRDATYFYWCWSAAHAFTRLGMKEVDATRGKLRWAEALAAELVERQRADGSWENRFTDSKEDDPLVATPFAAAALALCRQTIGR